MPIQHVFTSPKADDPDTSLIRPSDWNSAHAYTMQDAIAAGTQTASSGTVVFANSNGLSFGLSGSSQITGSYTVPSIAGLLSNINVSAGTTSNNLSAITFNNSNGISFGLNGSVLTGTVKTDYLTTAMASNRGSDFVQATAAFAGTSASGTIASNGISISIGPYLTTAMQSNAATISNLRVSGGTTSNLLSAITFGNANGISFGLNASTMTASHNAITTARASNDAIGLNTAQTNVTWTVNSSGLSLNAAGYAGTGTSATNASITLNSNGLAISVAAPGGGGVTPVASASNGSFSFTTIAFSNANNVTFGTSAGSIITASVAAPGAAAENNWVHLLGANTAGNTTASGSTVGYSAINLTLSGTNGSVVNISAPATSSLVGTSGVSLSTNGSTISVMDAPITQRRQWPPGNLTVVAAMGNGSYSLNRMVNYQQFSATRMDVPFLVSIATSATANTWGLAVTAFGAIYTKNSNTLSSLSSGSTTFSISLASNTAGTTQVIAHAVRPISIPVNVNMSVGEYYLGFGISTNTSSAGTATTALGNTWSVMGGPIYSSAVGQVGDFTEASNTSTGLFGGQGIYSAAISTVPPTVSLSAINQTGSYYARGNMGVIFRNI